MTPKPEDDLDRAHALMMAALDGECTAEERRELDRALTERPDLAAEWDRLRRVREVMAGMTLRRPPEETWDRFRTSAMHRAERSVAWMLIAAGAALLAAWVLWRWIEALLTVGDMPGPVRIGAIALLAGGLILVVSVVRERWFLHRRDPYSREVIR